MQLPHTQQIIPNVPLYQAVYGRPSRYSIVLVLLFALFIQPVTQAYADEVLEDDETETAATTDEVEAEGVETDTAADEESAASADESEDEEGETAEASSETESADEEDTATSTYAGSTESTATTSTDYTSDTGPATTTSDTEEVAGAATTSTATTVTDGTDTATTTGEDFDSATTTPEDTAPTTTESDTATSSEDDVGDGPAEEEVTTESDDAAESETDSGGGGGGRSGGDTDVNDDSSRDTDVSEETSSTESEEVSADSREDEDASVVAGTSTSRTEVTNRNNRYQFSEDQCVTMGNGSFYCHDTPQSELAVGDDEVVYAALSESGYRDIYLRTARDTRNITDSAYEDGAPTYDQQTETVVWHREIDGRYQIMSYDIRTDTIKQLTDTRVNDMQPSRSNTYTVWQRWVDGYWQIVLYDADTDEEELLTESQVHDVGPSVRGTYIIWNTTAANGEAQLAVYDIDTGLISYIVDDEGGRVSNPRFVLVYDTRLPSGDVITQGYDPETGQVEPLSAIPSDPPPDIPSPDPVGETRALAQPKTDSLDGEVVETDDDAAAATSTATTNTATTTASTTATATDYTLDMASSTATTSESLSEYDLVIPATTTATSSERNGTSTATSSAQSTDSD